jgi:predicted DNA repair protein MutK
VAICATRQESDTCEKLMESNCRFEHEQEHENEHENEREHEKEKEFVASSLPLRRVYCEEIVAQALVWLK